MQITFLSQLAFSLVHRVGANNRGTRFLSFVDTMLGYRHLLTPEDLNKAASMCGSLKGVLRSRFLVLSDDKDPPPPPVRVKRGHPDGDRVPRAEAKRFQTQGRHDVNRVGQSQAPAHVQVHANSTFQSQGGSHVSQTYSSVVGQSQTQNQHLAQVDVHGVSSAHAPAAPLNTSIPFEPVRGRRRRNPPGISGVTAIEIPTRVTPTRQAKTKNRVPAQPPPSPDAIEIDDDALSPESDAMDGGSGDSSTTVVDWVKIF